MTDTTLGVRNKLGDWRPPYTLEVPAPIAWPPKPRAVLRWFFGFPGYLWPWNAAYLAIATFTWFFLTPSLASMQSFELWWVALVYGRNLGLAVLIYGAWHLYLYIFRMQGDDFKYTTRRQDKHNKIFTFNNQVHDNMFWTLGSGVALWTAYEVVTLWAYANGLLPFINWETNPVWFVVLLVLIPAFRDIHFYLLHRLLHWRPLYEYAHKLHHRNVNPGPWSGISMHPFEHFLYFSGVILHWVVASHPIHALFHLQHAALSPPQGHTGFESVSYKGKSISVGTYGHYLHHKYFECNYSGDGFPVFDILFGTWHDGSDEAHARMNKRLQERQWAKRAAT